MSSHRLGTHSPVGVLGLDRRVSAQFCPIRVAVHTGEVGCVADMHIEAERIIDLGDDRVLVLSPQTARGKLSGAPFEHELAELITLEDGKIVRMTSYWHRTEALEAVGLSEQDAHSDS